MANKNIRTLSSRKELDDNLFENIALASQKEDSKEKLQELSKRFMLDDSVVLGTSTFYDFTREENKNKKVHVCTGTACMVARSQNNLHKNLEAHFNSDEIGHAACIGRCHTNNAFMYDDKTYNASTKEEVENIIKSKDYQINNYKVASNTTPILTSKIDAVTAFYQLAEQHKGNPQNTIQQIKTSNLRGRGGAGFPFWFKLDAVLKENNKQKYIVCNADEGDPGAYSDMYLMEHQAHKVLFGMYIAGLTVGADNGVLYIRGEYPD
jgi:NADH-quinone oxidoreductase subunit F